MDDDFPMQPMTSEAISEAGWKDGELRVTFRRSGKTYAYEVGEAVWVLLQQAPSKGRFMQSLLAVGVEI
jgi:hypothetical protein